MPTTPEDERHSLACNAMLPCPRDSISSLAPVDDGAEEDVRGIQTNALDVLLLRAARLCVTAADVWDVDSSLAEDPPGQTVVRESSKNSRHSAARPAMRCLRKQPHSRIASNAAITVQV